MSDDQIAPQAGDEPAVVKNYFVRISGNYSEVWKLGLWGSFLSVITLGLYRFWFITNLRRYFWKNTSIDGSPLEYTGRGIQLFLGFLVAIIIFLPILMLVFFAGQFSPILAPLASLVLFIFSWIFGNYALYRGRRYRLSHTYWRGIRFHQDGSPWRYCGTALLWQFLTFISFGLLYPQMSAKLERYRVNYTRLGNKNLTSNASWKDIAKGYYIIYAIIAVISIWSIAKLVPIIGQLEYLPPELIGPTIISSISGSIAILILLLPWFLAYQKKKFANKISLGKAQLEATFTTGVYYWGYLRYMGCLILASIAISILGFIFISIMDNSNIFIEGITPYNFMQNLHIIIPIALIYIAFIVIFSALHIMFMQYYVWKTIGNSITILHAEELDNIVRGQRDEESGLGEGIIDALDVGGGLEIGF